MSKKKNRKQQEGWAQVEFGEINLGDPRLNRRLIRIADYLSESPESPINQACPDWAETKGAYRFFKNKSVCEKDILTSHVKKTAERAEKHQIVLSIQDTCFFNYTSHKQTTGLGPISRKKETSGRTLSTAGVIMHTSFAVTTEGFPLGILDQTIFTRAPEEEEKKKRLNGYIAIEDKESIRWLNSLDKTQKAVRDSSVQVVTVCDREGDFYELFERADQKGASVLIRARNDRIINKISLYSENNDRLWSFMQSLPSQGTIEVEIPARDQKPARKALLKTRFSSCRMNPPRNHIRHKTEDLPDLNLNAVYVVEENPPKGEKTLEWMLLTNLTIVGFNDAIEKVRWYCLRWRIEVFHKILKSGLRVEQCRLQTADRLIRYLTVMSIIAWKIYWITLIGRANPEWPCTSFLEDQEWKVLYVRFHQTKSYPKTPPSVREAVRWIARLGGFLARKCDGEPGVITLWRGWKRLSELSKGWNLALA